MDASKKHLELITLNAQEKDWLVAHPEITIANTFNWPPYSFLDRNNQSVGPSIEFFELVAHMAHLLSWAVGAGLTAADALAMPFYHPVPEEALRSALGQILKQIDDPAPDFRLELCREPR